MYKVNICRYVLLVGLYHCLYFASQVYGEQQLPEIRILNEGYVAPIEGRNFVPGEQDDGARRVASTVALIKSEDAIIVIDPGMVPEEVDLTSKFKSAGIQPEDVTHVFISHHHPDHTVRLGMFPNATVVDFWGSYLNDVWEDHGDQFEIVEGIWVMQTPGHTDEDASLVVESEAGTYVFTHVWWNENLEPEIDPLAENQTKLVESRKKILKIADFIIPGHGKMFSNPEKDI